MEAIYMSNELKHEHKVGDFRISYIKLPGIVTSGMHHFHAHPTYELFYLCSGERLYYINGKKYYVKRGDLLLIDRHDIHKTTPTTVPDYERIVLQIPDSFISSLALVDVKLTDCFQYNSPVVLLPKKDQTFVESTLYSIIEEAKEQSLGYQSLIQTYLAQILIRVHRYAISANHQLDQATHIHKKITEVVAYIGDNYTSEITLPLLAERFHISTSHLARTFKKVTGLTIIEYLNTVRLSQAQKLLRKGSKSISDISGMVGFGSVTHFERLFKSASGYTPTQFRKLYLN